MSCSACPRPPASNRSPCFPKKTTTSKIATRSDQLEDREHEKCLREETAGKGQRTQHWYAERIDDAVRQARPEIKRAGESGRGGGDAQRAGRQNQRRKDYQVFDGVGMRGHQAARPWRLGFV